MKSKKIQLVKIQDVQELVTILINFNGDVDLISGRYVVDGKSLLGIFSLDLSKPIEIRVHNDAVAEKLFAAIAKYVVD
ncbi:MAG: HPr family phosphocarrier protein [Clostridia bacterium]|nr:HPr family phosphocarrier protein [Clostridia bacterium]